MPKCKEHEFCDLLCKHGYYCRRKDCRFVHQPWPDMPDDPEAYYNERAEKMP
jgi:hypothetical protein